MRNGFPVYLRLKNFVDTQNQEWSELGFTIQPIANPSGVLPGPVYDGLVLTGAGTLHSLTMGQDTYLYTENGAEGNTVGLAQAFVDYAATLTGALLNASPLVTASVSGNLVELAPLGVSGGVLDVSCGTIDALYDDTETLVGTTLQFWNMDPEALSIAPVGTTDILIKPPPTVSMISMHNIGISGGKLRFGARAFAIAATWVAQQCIAQNISDQNQIWRNPNVVGLVCEGMLFSIEDIKHQELAGTTVTWTLICNNTELTRSTQAPITIPAQT